MQARKGKESNGKRRHTFYNWIQIYTNWCIHIYHLNLCRLEKAKRATERDDTACRPNLASSICSWTQIHSYLSNKYKHNFNLIKCNYVCMLTNEPVRIYWEIGIEFVFWYKRDVAVKLILYLPSWKYLTNIHFFYKPLFHSSWMMVSMLFLMLMLMLVITLSKRKVRVPFVRVTRPKFLTLNTNARCTERANWSLK